jgi:glycosyltransferase involved in cell wall biosynthesis
LPPKCFFKEGDSAHLAQQLRNFLHSSLEEREKLGKSLREVVVQKHSLKRLSAELKDCFFILSGSN